MSDHDLPYAARIPADVERPDVIMFNLSARQLAVVATAGVALWLIYTATASFLPFAAFAVIATPVAGAVAAGVMVRRDGLGLDQLAVAALRHILLPRRLVPSASAPAALPEWISVDAGPLPAPLRLPPTAISTAGVVDLGRDGVAVVCACSTVNFSLRTPAEQHALISGFARWLNSLTGPVQMLVRADRLDPTPLITELEESAGGLPHPALEQAALDHADFLAQLADSRDLLRRHVLLIFREPVVSAGKNGSRETAARRVLRRADEAAGALAAAEITVHALEGHGAAAVLAAAADPGSPPPPEGLAPPGAIIHGPNPERE